MRPSIAWFSPLPPTRSGIAAYSAELLPLLREDFRIDTFPETAAHDFVWRHRRHPYDLVVYQLGNAPCHDYMWAYLVRYPGLVVLHDAKLPHARSRRLLQSGRAEDFRREFRYDQPGAPRDAAEYAVAGLGGIVYYLWPMVRVVIETARIVAVHNGLVAADLRDEHPDARIETIRMGVPAPGGDAAARDAIRRAHAIPDDEIVFAMFGKMTAEKRPAAVLNALAALRQEGRNVYLLVVGDAGEYASLEDELGAAVVKDRVRVAGYVDDGDVGAYLAAADACLCLRWPTADETSASWLRCLAARRATVITDLANLANVPRDAALRLDLLDEAGTLTSAMRRLAADPRAREAIADAGHAFWSAHHTMDAMAADYRRVLTLAASQPAPQPAGLPEHFLDDYTSRAKELLKEVGVTVDLFDE